jgi:hypothetical protein
LVVWKNEIIIFKMGLGKKVYINKNAGSTLYKWAPQPNNFQKKSEVSNVQNDKKDYCDAVAGSQGEDWVTKYVYDTELINYTPARIAYVECDYVE